MQDGTVRRLYSTVYTYLSLLHMYIQLQTVIAQFDVNGAGTDWKPTLHVSKEQCFRDGGLAHVVELVNNFLSQNVVT